ncbi:cadherin [Culex quinquefasciatus]|uniref:Cadherin n=1 Tax=Culex quinquefasciatus TaxID=7176 RepID=B0XG39_CULQU|nr:cadherin [Culex quinquefasciatus]|eukprot:XP_001868611.1 cadherin [Culex quinquefasciatus]
MPVITPELSEYNVDELHSEARNNSHVVDKDDLQEALRLLGKSKDSLNKTDQKTTYDITTLKAEYEGKFVNQDATLGQINHRVNHLHLNIDALENQKELIISGVPFASDEDPDALFATICRQLECSGGEELLTSTRRIHVNRLKDGDVSPLLVEFALKITRDRFYSTYKDT